MAIDLVNPGDGWFNRQGAFAGEFNRVAALYGTSTDVGFQSIWTLFATSDQAAVSPLPAAVVTFRQSDQAYCATLTTGAQNASRLQVDRDTPFIISTFPSSVQRVRQQMIDTGQTINRPTLTNAVVADGDNLGDTKFFASTTNIYGDPLDMTLNEEFTVVCTTQSTGFTSSFTAQGESTVTNNSWDWPQGSGVRVAVAVVDPAVNGFVTNSSLSTFTVANTPDDWTITNGAAGVTVFKSTNGGVRGDDCVFLQSDGAQSTKLVQDVTLQTNVAYAVTFQAKMNTNSAAGTFVVDLYDPDTATVIANDAGDDLEVTYALNGGAGELTTSYQLLTVFFSTPRQLPSTVQIRIGYGTAATSTRQLFLCNVQIFNATPLYGAQNTGTSGPFVCAVANTTVSAVGDAYSITFTNSLSNQSFVWGLQRLHDFRSAGLYLPSSNSPTISDALVLH